MTMNEKELMGALANCGQAILHAAESLLDGDIVVRRKRKRSCWVSPWLLKRPEEGASSKLLLELRNGINLEQKLYAQFHRLSEADFDHLHALVAPIIRKRDTNMRLAIPTDVRLRLTLHFLATGNSFHSLQYLFRLPQCTISIIIPETLDAIYNVLAPTYLQTPSSAEEWEEVARKFEANWNFPNCVGALDGKYVVIVAPPNSGSVFYNYKGTHSIVLMAICDAEYKFIYVDVGCNGRESDGGVFNKCSFSGAMENGSLNFPAAKPLPGRTGALPYVIIADDAFALRPNIMKPYSGRNLPATKRIFNYRLSRGRRTIENEFGIMSARFRVLRSAINLDASKTRKVVKATCVLHNFLLQRNGNSYAPKGFADACDADGTITDGSWRNEPPSSSFLDLQPAEGRDRTISGNAVRDEFTDFFIGTDGEVSWQYQKI